MHLIDFKIAFRAFRNAKFYYLLNIGGLAISLAAYILVSLYVNSEHSYDQWNPNADRIFLVERELPDGASPYTPGQLANALKSQCPEIEETGRINTALFQLPFYTASGRYLVKKWLGADYSIASMLGIQPTGTKLNPDHAALSILLSKEAAEVLFPGKQSVENESVNLVSKSGMPMPVAGIVADRPGLTNLQFDCIGFSTDLTQGKDQSYANQIYQTYILVRPNANVALLTQKIDRIYKKAAMADTSQIAKEVLSRTGRASIYLDALVNLHLKPHYGSRANSHLVNVLATLAFIIIVVSAVNFTSLYISQADKRAKEVGIKKVNGVTKSHIIHQFLTEIIIQCVIALFLSVIIVSIGLPYFNQLLQVNLLISSVTMSAGPQILLMLVIVFLVAGLYPAIMISGFVPAEVLRGSPYIAGGKISWVKNIITLLQLTFAIAFVIALWIINQQVSFMKNEDTGFHTRQIVYIDNLTLFNNPRDFQPVRARIKSIPGVKEVTVASNIPGGNLPATHEFTWQNHSFTAHTISVDYGYFNTLGIALKKGNVFNNPVPGDSLNLVINEAAARKINFANPVASMLNGCGSRYRIIGVVKDTKAYGFEQATVPTVYFMNDHCGLSKTQLMISVENNQMRHVLKALDHDWKNINPRDGDNFNYHFLDELYGKLFIKQEQLRSVLTFFTVVAVCIAAIGFFSLAAQRLRFKTKEVSIRKVLGANAQQLVITLSKPFFYLLLWANCLAWPAAFWATRLWLESFAYHINITAVPYIAGGVLSVMIIALTVSFQLFKAVHANLALKLKA